MIPSLRRYGPVCFIGAARGGPQGIETVSVPVTSQAAKSLLGVGEVVAGRFEVVALADWGGMGAVYRARDREQGRDVAIKLLLDASSEERFAREARVLADLKHPGIVEYVAHGRTERGALYLADALTLARAAALAVGAAHARGIVHRDVNPRNLFLVGGDVRDVKILDFGIARPLRATFAMTLPGEYLGTPGYLAPEQARGSDEVDARADVFALGCVLFECLTGKPAFLADNLMALLGKVIFEEAPHLGKFGEFPPAVDDLVARMMAKDVAVRPLDAVEVAAQIDLLGQPTDPEPPSEAPESTVPRSITDDEQRLVCVVMAASAPGAAAFTRDGGTLVSAGVDSTRPSSLARFGARIERLPPGCSICASTSSRRWGTRSCAGRGSRATWRARCSDARRRAWGGIGTFARWRRPSTSASTSAWRAGCWSSGRRGSARRGCGASSFGASAAATTRSRCSSGGPIR